MRQALKHLLGGGAPFAKDMHSLRFQLFLPPKMIPQTGKAAFIHKVA